MADLRELNADELAELRDKFCEKIDQLIDTTKFLMKLHGDTGLTTNVLDDLDALRNGRKSLPEIVADNKKNFKNPKRQSQNNSWPIMLLAGKTESEGIWSQVSGNQELQLKMLSDWESIYFGNCSSVIQGFVNRNRCEVSISGCFGEKKILSNIIECFFAIQNPLVSQANYLDFTKGINMLKEQWISERPIFDDIQHLNSEYGRNWIASAYTNARNPKNDYRYNAECIAATR